MRFKPEYDISAFCGDDGGKHALNVLRWDVSSKCFMATDSVTLAVVQADEDDFLTESISLPSELFVGAGEKAITVSGGKVKVSAGRSACPENRGLQDARGLANSLLSGPPVRALISRKQLRRVLDYAESHGVSDTISLTVRQVPREPPLEIAIPLGDGRHAYFVVAALHSGDAVPPLASILDAGEQEEREQ